MAANERIVVMGEDVGRLGGVFRVTDGLQDAFGADRVIDTPLAESAIIGTAIGLAMRGFRPVCEIQFDGFVYPAFDQIVSQLAKMRYRSGGRVALPVTVRIPFGGGIGAVEHHSESPEAYFCHTAGLRVVSCSNPADANTMIRQAVASDDPVIFFEPKRRYWDKAELDPDAPLVFFCQNNQWAISEPAERQSRVPLFERARGFGFPSVRVDGNDVLATMAVTRWALAEARAGRGPVLVEALTYRMGAHTTADDPTRYRDPGELEAWRLRDPVNRLAAYLTVRRAVDAERLAVFAAEADAVAADTRRRCLALPDPPPERIFDGVLAGETDLLRGQRAMLRRLLGGPDAPVPTAAGVPAAPSVPAAVRRAI
jgi:hypothetical protein